MSIPLILEVDFILTSPAFLGGADMMAALRPQSFKGLLRHYHRVIDCTLMESDKAREDRIWGGAGKGFGQSKVLLRIQPKSNINRWKYDRNELSRYKKGRGKGKEKYPLNGIIYLGYPFDMGKNKQRDARDALGPSTSTQFTLQGVIPAAGDLSREDVRAITASFWLLAVLGSCGSRSRRGFGSLQPTGWRLQNAGSFPTFDKIFKTLPRPGQANSSGAWHEAIKDARQLFNNWFGHFPHHTAHAHLGRNFSCVILPGHNSWESAIAEGGAEMQKFRRSREPDRTTAEKFLTHPQNNIVAPERASFGLPLSFRFKKLEGEVQFLPGRPNPNADSPERFASLLSLKIIRLDMRYHPLYFLYDGLEPALELNTIARFRHKTFTTRRPENSALRIFFKELKEKGV